MATHFYPLTVASVDRETPDCVSIAFHVPDELQQIFAFTPGQHLTLRNIIKGAEVRRNYSLCSCPLDKEWRIAIKKVEEGIFSNYANNNLKAGDVLDVMPPLGKFFSVQNTKNKKHYVAVAAGSGITPVISIIETILRTEPSCEFTLVYANQYKHTIIFKERLEALKDKYLQRFSIHHIFSRQLTEAPLNYGRINEEKCLLIFSVIVPLSNIDGVFICGPVGLIETVKGYLESKKFPKEKIHVEFFEGAKQAITIKQQDNFDSIINSALVNITLDGRTFSILLRFNDESILDAALKQGADLPYACKGGVCTTCRAKLMEGKVHMDVNYGLDESEIAQGIILTCQSHPLTAKVVVNYDEH